MKRREINRRQALGILGAAGVGTVVLGACSSDGDDPGASANGGSSTTSSTGGPARTEDNGELEFLLVLGR